jgi:hypothetical protein
MKDREGQELELVRVCQAHRLVWSKCKDRPWGRGSVINEICSNYSKMLEERWLPEHGRALSYINSGHPGLELDVVSGSSQTQLY